MRYRVKVCITIADSNPFADLSLGFLAVQTAQLKGFDELKVAVDVFIPRCVLLVDRHTH